MNIRILSQKNLRSVLDIAQAVDIVEEVYKIKANGQAAAWPLIEYHFDDHSVMDIRSGGIFGSIGIHGAKLLNNFPENEKKGLPVFTGVLMAFDSDTGIPLGIMDASYVTCIRTGAAGAVSTRALARKDAKTLLIIGAGRQAFFQLGAVISAMPGIQKILVNDPVAPQLAEHFVSTISQRLKEELNVDASSVDFQQVNSTEDAVYAADTIITITRATSPVIKKEWVKPGTHISCIGADMIGKEEIDPELFRDSRVFCDDIPQCCAVGESEIPYKRGIIKEENFAGEIGQALNGDIPGRTSDQEITIFDATGLAALDMATAKIAIDSAIKKELGTIAEI